MERTERGEDRGPRTEDRGQRPGHRTHPSSGLSVFSHLSSVLILLLVCGCEYLFLQEEDGMANSYYLAPNKDLHRLGRVALVELDNMSTYPEISKEMTEALFLETQKKQVFGIAVVRHEDPVWRSLRENLDSLETLRQSAAIRETLNCNGLLVGTITRYQPYPHMIIGLRLKLLDLTDGQLIWGVEQIWDSHDRSIQKRIRAYLKDQRQAGETDVREDLVIVSSLSFCKFVAYEVAGTFVREKKK